MVGHGERVCGSGRFSNVYSADLILPEQRKVAIKNSWETKKDVNLKSQLYPEIEMLSKIPPHPNIVTLLYYFTRKIENEVIHCLILDYFPFDVQRLREKGVKFDALDAQLYSYQLFSAVAFLSVCKVIHLDIKPSNLVINHEDGLLKLADFGNAVHCGAKTNNSYQVTRYYRPPELLFGSTTLTPAIDLWSAACVVYDFICTKTLFKGRNTHDQIKLIVEILGYPSSDEVKSMACTRPRVHRATARGLDKYVGYGFDKKALLLLQDVLVYDPKKRKAATEILQHDYFKELLQQPPRIRFNNKPIPPLILEKPNDSKDSEDDGSET
ncbi:kinase domain protein [Dictyocaulus viviparus]|uniref:Kinase domain protein n=1 Tax=Dictyocaulus viviparus TaxID=29172 RepID=A0A0D8Y506_DICVI|nr:kinase domain protein [Dictyocaulus viviparus]